VCEREVSVKLEDERKTTGRQEEKGKVQSKKIKAKMVAMRKRRTT